MKAPALLHTITALNVLMYSDSHVTSEINLMSWFTNTVYHLFNAVYLTHCLRFSHSITIYFSTAGSPEHVNYIFTWPLALWCAIFKLLIYSYSSRFSHEAGHRICRATHLLFFTSALDCKPSALNLWIGMFYFKWTSKKAVFVKTPS